MIAMHLTQSFLSRSVLFSIFTIGISGNKWLIGSFFLSLAFTMLGIECPGLNHWLDLCSIGGIGWIIVFICVLIHFALVEVAKSLLRLAYKPEGIGILPRNIVVSVSKPDIATNYLPPVPNLV